MTQSSLRNIRFVSAGAFLSGLVATDLFLNFFCSGWPLLFYLGFGGLGAWLAERLHRRFFSGVWMRRVAIGLALFSAVGMVALSVMPVQWGTKCSWRYCGRALGPGLFLSPFSVGTPSCSGWSTCINEYPYSHSESREVLRHIAKQGCPAP